MAIAVDNTTPAYVAVANGSATGTTASFTPPSGSLGVLMWASAVNRTIVSIGGTPTLSWTSRKILTGANGGDEDVEIWIADLSNVSTTVSVTSQTMNGANQAAFGVAVVTGAAAAASQTTGATNSASANGTSTLVSIGATTTANGSQVFASIASRNTSAFTDGSGQTNTFGTQSFINNNGHWGQTTATPTATSGTLVTLTDTLSPSNEWAAVAVEILAGAAGPTNPAIAPQIISGHSTYF